MEEMNQIVVFKVGKEFYGAKIISIKEIKEYAKVTKLPQMPEGMEGVINLRGNIHAIFSLSAKIGLGKKEDDTRSKIIVVNEKNIGFIVDEVNEIIRIEENDIDTSSNLPSYIKKEYISCIVKKNEKIIVVLDLLKLFGLTEEVGEEDIQLISS